MNFDLFEKIYAAVCEFAYAVMSIFGYEVVDGAIVKVKK